MFIVTSSHMLLQIIIDVGRFAYSEIIIIIKDLFLQINQINIYRLRNITAVIVGMTHKAVVMHLSVELKIMIKVKYT